MGVRSGSEKCSPTNLVQQSCFFVLVLVCVCTLLVCNGDNFEHLFQPVQLEALQTIWGAWSTSTPNPESNLAGWSSSQLYPCIQEITENLYPDWRGVQCITNAACTESINETVCNVFITGLSLDDASISGVLPSAIGNISTLTILELTGNPDLLGPLPAELSETNLFILDLHENAFSGEIPNLRLLFVQNLNLGGNRFTGPFPSLSQINSDLHILNLSRNDLEGGIPQNAFANMTQLLQLDLSSNRFNGSLPTLSAMENLQTLYLDDNLINGTLNVTDLFAQGLLSARSLRALSLMNNSIENVVYDKSFMENITTNILLQGNPYCRLPDADNGTRCFCTQVCAFNTDVSAGYQGKRKTVIVAVVTSVSSSLVIFMIVIVALLIKNRKYKRYLELQVQQKFEEFEVKPTIFPYHQLRTATQDFHSDMKLGQGSFGAVYKGILSEGNVVAVKQLFALKDQGIDEFLNEVVLLTGIRHRNLVNLKGCCIREQQRLLVYEYVDNYDVHKLLLENPDKVFLSWPIRLKICLGVARGLHYLHALAYPRIIHRDIKASNILLTKNYESKIADFGLASLFPDEESYIMTKHVAGTKGYLAPEYASYGQLSDKVDVFSFGVLCLEVVSGRRNINEKLPPHERYLPNWAWDLHQRGRLMDLVDPTMSLQDEEKLAVKRLINIALLCIQMAAEQRPSMERIVAMLQGNSDLGTVVLQSDNKEQALNSMRWFAFGQSGLGTVIEAGESSDMESWFMESSRQEAGLSGTDSRSYTTSVELSGIKSGK